MPKGIYLRTKNMKTGKHMLGRKLTKEHKRNIGSALKGHLTSEITKAKISKAQKGKFKGVHRSSKTEFKGGENSLNWKGGISNNKKYINWLKNRRNRVKKIADGSHTFGEWENLKAQYNWTCLCCKRKEPKIKLTEDHIISLSKGGSDNIENIQPLCRPCNSKKHTKIINYIQINELEKGN